MNDSNAFWRDYLDVLLRRWQVLIAMPILAMIAAAIVSFLSPTIYEATALVALNPSTLSVPSLNQSPPYYLMVDSPNHLPTAYSPAFYVELLKSAEVVSAVNQPTVTVSISPNSADRALLEISARATSPELAAQTANLYAEVGAQFIAKAFVPSSQIAALADEKLKVADDALSRFSLDNGLGDYDLTKLKAAVLPSYAKKIELASLLRARQVAESVSLELARDQARGTILAATANKPIAISKPAPAAPIAPKTAQNILVGGALGLMVGIIAAFAVEYLTPARN
jgi:capsular polysaccharide biosynthesis protein